MFYDILSFLVEKQIKVPFLFSTQCISGKTKVTEIDSLEHH